MRQRLLCAITVLGSEFTQVSRYGLSNLRSKIERRKAVAS